MRNQLEKGSALFVFEVIPVKAGRVELCKEGPH